MTVEATMTIDGKPVAGDDWITVVNPAHKSTTVGRFPNATPTQVDDAVQSAKAAFPEWRATPVAERAALLAKASGVIFERMGDWVPLLTQENGKILAESGMDFFGAGSLYGSWVNHIDWMDDEEDVNDARRLVIRKEPMGVCAGIVPWNFPQVLASLPISTALFSGNTMVLKAPEFGPLALLQSLAEVSAIFPPGVLNVVSGFGPEAGRALVRHPDVRKVSFTGASPTGKSVMADAADTLTRLTLELGGNDAALVLEDADLSDQMVERMVTGVYMHTGQICFAIKRLYVHESRYQELTDKLRAVIDQIVVGDGMRPDVTMGPLQNERQYEKVRGILADTKKSCEVEELGSYAEGTDLDDGYFMLPHLVLNPGDDQTIVSCEQMGPILPVMSFRDEDEAVARANDSEYGLTSSVWSADKAHAFDVGLRLEAGKTSINGHGLMATDTDSPLGGYKESGMGYAGHKAGLAAYVQIHAVSDTYMG